MGGRFAGVLGWAGIATTIGGVFLTGSRVAGIDSEAAQDFNAPVVLLLFLGVAAVAAMFLFPPDSDSEQPGKALASPGTARLVGRIVLVVAGIGVVWWAFPTHFLPPNASGSGLYLTEAFQVWGGLCAIVLGLALMARAPAVLHPRDWKGVVLGVAAGVSVLALVAALTPVLTTWVEVEHRVAASGEPEPFPTDVTRVGWSWEPESAIQEMGRGPRGPVVRYQDGFVGLDGASGEELWTYRLPYSDRVELGFVPGDEEHAYLLLRESREPTLLSLVVLDTATGEVVREGSVPDALDSHPWKRHVNADRMMGVEEDGQGASLVGYGIDSAEPAWEYSLHEERGRVCLPREGARLHLHGERLLASRTCLDEDHLDEDVLEEAGSTLSYALDELGRPDDAVRILTVLDTTTGEEVWRREEAPPRPLGDDETHIGPTRASGAGDPVVVFGDRLFDLHTGEPVDVLPEDPEDSGEDSYRERLDPGTLTVDTEGAVVAQRTRSALYEQVLRTDADGEVVDTVEIDSGVGAYIRSPYEGYGPDDSAAGLESALVSTTYTWEADEVEEGERAVLVLPMEDTDTERAGTPRWIRFDGERLFDPDFSPGDVRHGVLSVPGAVVSYVDGGYQSEGFPPVHGLVP